MGLPTPHPSSPARTRAAGGSPSQASILARERNISVERVEAGELVVSAGTIAAFDPLSAARAQPFTREVAPGKYRVELLKTKQDQRFALARVVFGSGTPAAWELAVKPGEDPRTLRPGQIHGYGVDSGTGCFADGSAVARLANHMITDAILKAGGLIRSWLTR